MGINQLVLEALAVGKHQHLKRTIFDVRQMKMGRNVEKEHTDNPKLADEIAKDHLAEIPDYYTRLNKMEADAKKEGSYTDPDKKKSSQMRET